MQENDDPTDLVAEQERNAQNAEAEAYLQRVIGDDIAWLMADKRGRRFMRRLLGRCGVWNLSYAPGGSVNDALFYEGRRDIGNMLLVQINTHCPDQYTTMNREAQHDNGNSSPRTNARNSPGRNAAG